MITINLDNLEKTTGIQLKKDIFPDGTHKFTIIENDKTLPSDTIKIIVTFDNYEKIWDLALIKNLIDEYYKGKYQVNLQIRYLMYQQDDRRFSKQETFGLKLIIDFVNNLYFNKVEVFCPHSDTVDMFNYYEDNNSFLFFFEWAIYRIILSNNILKHKFTYDDVMQNTLKNIIWVIPDNGAYKKQVKIIQSFAKEFNVNIKYVIVNKDRNLITNEVNIELKTKVDLHDSHCIIFDDICLGGRTFIETSKALRDAGAKNVDLIVAHGIFNNGLDEIYKHIDKIITSDSICKLSETDRLNIINV